MAEQMVVRQHRFDTDQGGEEQRGNAQKRGEEALEKKYVLQDRKVWSPECEVMVFPQV